MDIERQIEEISKYVDMASEPICVTEVNQNMVKFNQDLEDVLNVLEAHSDDIDSRRNKQLQEIQKMNEQPAALDAEWKLVQADRNEATARQAEVIGQLKAAEEKLRQVEEEIINFKKETESALKMAENIPKLSQCKRLMYKISRLTFDKNRENTIRGFVVNTRADDVHSFKFNTENHSPQFISNYVWDLIAAGTDDAWRK